MVWGFRGVWLVGWFVISLALFPFCLGDTGNIERIHVAFSSIAKSDKVLVKLFPFRIDFYYRGRKLRAYFTMVTFPFSLT